MTGTRDAQQRVVRAADVLFYEQGFAATGVDAIAKRAGVGKMSLYRHYAGKDELAAAALSLRDETHLDWLLPENERDGRQRVREMFGRIGQAATAPQYHGCPFIRAGLELPAGHPAQRAVAGYRGRLQLRLRVLAWRLGVRDPDALARQLIVLLDGAASGCAVQRDPAPALHALEMALLAIGAATADPEKVETDK